MCWDFNILKKQESETFLTALIFRCDRGERVAELYQKNLELCSLFQASNSCTLKIYCSKLATLLLPPLLRAPMPLTNIIAVFALLNVAFRLDEF